MPKRKSLAEAFGTEAEPETPEIEQSAAELAEGAQYGKRADPRYTQISGNIPESLKRQFKAQVSLEGTDLSTKLEELIRSYIEGK